VLNISKQAVHKLLNRYKRAKEEQMQLLHIVHQVRQDHPTMGVRDIYFKVQPEGIGRDCFERFCREWELMSKKIKNHYRTTDSSGVIRFDNLIKDLTVNRLNQVWQSDITYYEVGSRFYYITFIVDGYSRRIIGHHTSQRLYTESTTLPALKKAIKIRKGHNLEGLIFHSDGGGQYYDKAFLALTADYKIKNSMCEYAWENGKAERVNGVIKNNYLKHRKIRNYKELVKEVDRAVLLYDREKPHIKLQRRTPITFEMEILNLQKQTKLKIKESIDAREQILGALSPPKSEQTKYQNQDVISAICTN
jgi:putative transposase